MSRFFVHADHADENGLVRIGGKLTPDWLLDAYAHGIFPWPLSDRTRTILAWFSVDPRGVFEFDRFHVSRRLERTCKSERFRITSDTDFSSVIQGCAEQREPEGTWITPKMRNAYTELHRLGYAHSVEAWNGDKLAGGVYGVAIGGLFAAESMFFRYRDASKVALVALMRHLKKRGYQLVDIQVITEHTVRFGAVEISRLEYLRRLRLALQQNIEFGAIGAEGDVGEDRSYENEKEPQSYLRLLLLSLPRTSGSVVFATRALSRHLTAM
jgi:leucyl/phenylalanyl-tRNA--protein transferase